jgi:hypothetical protein
MDKKTGTGFYTNRFRENFSNCMNELVQIAYSSAKTPLLFFSAVGVSSIQPQSRLEQGVFAEKSHKAIVNN